MCVWGGTPGKLESRYYFIRVSREDQGHKKHSMSCNVRNNFLSNVVPENNRSASKVDVVVAAVHCHHWQ